MKTKHSYVITRKDYSMKKGTNIGVGIVSLLLGVVALSGCTNSFCTVVDKAHILYAIDHGVSNMTPKKKRLHT